MKQAASGFEEFALGWPIVLASALGIGLGLSPVPFYTIGMFAPELSREFGWGFGEIMFGLTVMTAVVLIASPIVGWLADRYGVRRVALTSVVLFSGSFALFALGNGSLLMFYATWGLMAAVGTGTLPITWTRAVNLWFERKKGLALGLALIGTGIFGAAIKPLTAWLIATIGWRGAYVVIAALPFALALPVAWRYFREAPEQSEAQRQQARDDAAAGIVPQAQQGMSLGQVLRDWRFWVLFGALVPISFAIAGPTPNMENILGSSGFSKLEIAQLVPVIGLSVLVGRTLGGWLIDHFWAPGVAFVLLSLPAAACWVLASGEVSFAVAMVSIFLIGFAAGVEYDLLAFLVARYFGMKSYSTVYGLLYCAFAIGAGVGPVVFGMVYDRTHSYSSILLVSMVILLVGALMLLTLGRYRQFGNRIEMAPVAEPQQPEQGQVHKVQTA